MNALVTSYLILLEVKHLSELGESNLTGILSEALSADVETVLSDETVLICANSASS